MKHRQAMKFKLTENEIQKFKSVSDFLQRILRHLPSDHKIKTLDHSKYTIDDIKAAMYLVYSIGESDMFISYSTIEEESY